jgi:hypothetical protein
LGLPVVRSGLFELIGYLSPQLRRLEHLGIGTPTQDPAPDLVEAGHAGTPAQRSIALDLEFLARMPARLGDPRRDPSRETRAA